MSDFEKSVRKALIDKDMRLSELANELGASVGYFHQIFRGDRKATDFKKRVADHLGFKLKE